VRGQPRAALGHRKSLVDIGVQLRGELLFLPVWLGGQGLEPVPFGAQPAHLLVELLIGHDVRVQCPDPVADLIQLVLVVGALDQDEPLDPERD
jgi:hypothetical protein